MSKNVGGFLLQFDSISRLTIPPTDPLIPIFYGNNFFFFRINCFTVSLTNKLNI